MMKKGKRIKIKKVFIILLCLSLILTGTLLSINSYIKKTVSEKILTSEEAVELENVDCIIILGCYVKENGLPSDMLRDRLTRGIEIYELKAAPKIIMSGDHGRLEYDEVNVMKQYAIDSGISSSDIFMDHAGFSTYDTIYRAKAIFGVEKVIIVTQEYHLYRALYIADKLGIEAYGVGSDYYTYVGQQMREFREILARNKDFVKIIFKPEATYLGEFIPISGDGDITND